MPAGLREAAKAAARRAKNRLTSLGETDDHMIKSTMKKRPRKRSKFERTETGISPRGRTHDN